MRRMWINQPSTLQPNHKLHGINVLACPREIIDFEINEPTRRIYFLDGPVISMEILASSLSDGWKSK